MKNMQARALMKAKYMTSDYREDGGAVTSRHHYLALSVDETRMLCGHLMRLYAEDGLCVTPSIGYDNQPGVMLTTIRFCVPNHQKAAVKALVDYLEAAYGYDTANAVPATFSRIAAAPAPQTPKPCGAQPR